MQLHYSPRNKLSLEQKLYKLMMLPNILSYLLNIEEILFIYLLSVDHGHHGQLLMWQRKDVVVE